jgi:hypothetical protein
VPAITWVKTPEVPFALTTSFGSFSEISHTANRLCARGGRTLCPCEAKKVLRRNRQMRPSPSRGRNRARRAS